MRYPGSVEKLPTLIIYEGVFNPGVFNLSINSPWNCKK